MLIALGSAIAIWSQSESSLIEVLSHGRRSLPEIDVSRSTGFFLSYNPVFIQRSTTGGLAEKVESIRSSQSWSWSFDFIKYYHPEESVRKKMEDLPQAEVLFNYVGKAIALDESEKLQTVDISRGTESDPSGIRGHLLAVLAQYDLQNQIEIVWVYSKHFLSRNQMRVLQEIYLEELDKLVVA